LGWSGALLARIGCNDHCCSLRYFFGEKEPERSGIGWEGETITRRIGTNRRSHSFDAEADRYDQWFESREGKALFEIEKNCLQTLVQTVTGRWLEVGVGSGRFAMSLGISEGVDPSLGMVTIAACRGIHVVQGMGEELPFQDAVFAGILMVTTLCFLTSPERAVSECRRVLRSRGTLVVAIMPAESAWGRLYRAKGCEGHPLYSHANLYTCEEVIRFCGEAGFVFERAVSCLQTPPGEKPNSSLEEGINESAGFVAMRFHNT
jgi:ubiquinone/menaquinone biosynthesis C-methylase UbiE